MPNPIVYDVFQTSWGWVAAASSRNGVCVSSLPADSPQRALEEVQAHLGRFDLRHDDGLHRDFRRQVEAYLEGDAVEWDVSLDLDDAPAFFRRAWAACRSIPRGETRPYAWLAAEAGRPGAARAAGQAMARNRVPLVIPCHRVVGSDGTLHGFGGGLPMKARLLAMERGEPSPQPSPGERGRGLVLPPASREGVRGRAGARR